MSTGKWKLAGSSLLLAALLLAMLHVQAVSQDITRVSVTFHAGEGQGSPPRAISCTAGDSVTAPEAQLEAGSRRFTGWAGWSGASDPQYCPGDAIPLKEDTILYAVYTDRDYTVVYQVGEERFYETVLPGEPLSKAPSLTGTGYDQWLSEGGQTVVPGELRVWRSQTLTAHSTSYSSLKPGKVTLKDDSRHDKYMDSDNSGLFHPEAPLTRGELACLLSDLIAQTPRKEASFPDVPKSAWYAQGVATVAGLGVMSGYSDGLFWPDQPVTRAECAAVLAGLLPAENRQAREITYLDVPETFWAYDAVSAVSAAGLFGGDQEGRFNPNSSLLRAQAAVVFNKLLDRQVDKATLTVAGVPRIFPDVPSTHWAYAQIMEATVSHDSRTEPGGHEVWTSAAQERTALSDGFYRINGRLYCVQNGRFLHDTTQGVFTFDHEGRYTTGIDELDRRLNSIVEAQTNDSMTRDQKLRALYNYIRDSYTYLKRPNVTKDQTGWQGEYALFFLENGKGNCFCFAAAYSFLCRELGLPAGTVVGGQGPNGNPHGWVEMELDGVNYMFDPELEWYFVHRQGTRKYDLFKMQPSQAPAALRYVW